jgi:hypothetical protein
MSAYIGNSPQFGVFRKLDALTFNGSTTTFTLLSGGAQILVGDPAQLFISLNGVIQEPGAAFTLATGGSQIVFNPAPTSGMAFFGIILGVKGAPTVDDGQITPAKLDRTYATPADVTTAVNNLIDGAPGALDTLNELAAAMSDDANFGTTVTNALNLRVTKSSSTGSALVPSGTTAQRDGTPAAGYFRFNSSTNSFEGYNGTTWGAVGGGATGGTNNPVFYENDQTVSVTYTITTGKNAMTAGPVTIADGVNVTIPDGSTWTIV